MASKTPIAVSIRSMLIDFPSYDLMPSWRTKKTTKKCGVGE
jgi:hypothetical protein